MGIDTNLRRWGDAEIRQHVITKLGSETGLIMVKELTDLMVAVQHSKADRMMIFKNHAIPFYQMISHSDVLSSLLLETPVDIIYTFLFGPTAIKDLDLSDSHNDETFSTLALSSTLAVLDRLTEVNQSAQVIDGFIPIIKDIAACIPEHAALPIGRQCLSRIQYRLNIGASYPEVSKKPAPHVGSATFSLSQDLPGNLSKRGPRHDNDHQNISKIQILPTAREITSQRAEYLPTTDSSMHHLPGLAGLLDRQFRLLREDTVGQLRDAVREEYVRLGRPKQDILKSLQNEGVRRIVYINVHLTLVQMNRRKGLQIVAEFDQPAQIRNKSAKQRKEWWDSRKLLQVDSLLCFISSIGKIIFFTVCDPSPSFSRKGTKSETSSENAEPPYIPSLFEDPKRATVLLSMAEYKSDDAFWIYTHLGTHVKSHQSLVEFPGILLPSFQPTLQALQKMSRTLNLPFAEVVAPHSPSEDTITIKPPAYTIRHGFKYNLDVLVGEPLSLEPGRAFDFKKLAERSTLDRGQQTAVVQSLSSRLALIQGPPGTGKSYTGVAIIKSLLANRKAAKLGPIICVCYTNHALDQLLEHLVKDGVEQVIRIGSRSKSELLQKLNLSYVSKEMVQTKTEKHDIWKHNMDIDKRITELESSLAGLNSPWSWNNIRRYLEKTNPTHLSELFLRLQDDGWQQQQGRKNKVLENWLRGAPKMFVSNRPVPELLSQSLHQMSSTERRAIHEYWIQQQITDLSFELTDGLGEFYASKSALEKCHHELDVRCLREAHIIGVTTSGLARNIEVLRRTQAKVMLCEEAGEVLEAHTLTAFLPGIEHLRPQTNNHELRHDNPKGKRYSLDISLFERLVQPLEGNVKVPFTTLNVQRRMHPSIAEPVRVPLYPELQDHSSVSEYPEVVGMKHRLYWFSHQEKEDQRAAQSISLSRTNNFEVEFIAALVSHLVRQGIYGSEDIAVITPYLGQLQKIRKRLSNSFEIVVGDRDQEELEATGLEEMEASPPGQEGKVQKTTLLKALRIATVDNFQGEEAKVVVVSLVRSNDENNCGFLKTSNRINVLLSRARHGMYIIGNSRTARPVPMWDKVISILEKSNNIGPSLALCCPRHKDTPIQVSTPDDFARLAPEGGCALKCAWRLQCGHSCPNKCHSTSLHHAVRCLERCPRTKKGCEHACPKYCGDPCDKECQVVMHNIRLRCGHIAKTLKCHETQHLEGVQCQVRIEQIVPRCKHKAMVRCHELPLTDDYVCTATCGTALNCGHNCTYACKDCNIKEEGKPIQTLHGACKTPCGRPYSTCSHSCNAPCHGEQPCPLCTSPCEVSCAHSKCQKLCQEPCIPCAEDCSWSCPHRGKCPLPCAVPCNLLPCSERCSAILECGHRCPSICGEKCPSTRFCQTCANTETKEMVADFILSSTYEEVDLDETPCMFPPCGHILTVESMDGHMGMSDIYISDAEGKFIGLKGVSEPFSKSSMKSCPTCRGPLRSLNRYGRIVRRALIDEATKRFIVWANIGFGPLEARMREIEENLRGASHDGDIMKEGTALETLQLKGTCDEQISKIGPIVKKQDLYKPILELRKNIKSFLQQVDETEQPFGRIFDLVQDSRRHRGIEVEFTWNSEILQVRNRILTTVLLLRCDHTILITFLKNCKAKKGTNVPNVNVDFSINRRECEELIAECDVKSQIAASVEGHLYWARFVALERGIAEMESTELLQTMTSLVDEARDHLKQAEAICIRYPGQTAGMLNEVEEVKSMLRDSTFYLPVSNEEKAAVYAAMAREFRGTGHWYYCENGHPFTIGECGMPMERARCPQCDAQIGGQGHQAVDGVQRATDIEELFGGVRI
ncbi:hypothetical protein F5884DRAFT_876247 [Xylogone sp. PMI_703]|nr:hypothetical protein F5884DRAFT_876247 [Xylogone sp. PMI_703]